MAGYYRRPSKARRNFASDARKIKDSAFKHTLRDAESYRDERLEGERERLEKRLAWAMQQDNAAEVKRLERRLDKLADEALTDIDAGRTPGNLERWKRELYP